METADRAAGNRDADEGKHWTWNNKSAAVDERSDGRHLQGRSEYHDENPKDGDRAEFHECAQVITRG